MGVTGKIDFNIRVTDANTTDLGTDVQNHLLELAKTYSDGATTGLINEVWSETYTTVAAAFTNLDFTNMPAATGDPRGAGVSFSKVKGIFIKKSTPTDYLKYGGGTNCGAAVDAFAGVDDYPLADDSDLGQIVGSNGLMVWVNEDGATVGAGTAVLGVGAVTTDQTWSIVVIGIS